MASTAELKINIRPTLNNTELDAIIASMKQSLAELTKIAPLGPDVLSDPLEGAKKKATETSKAVGGVGDAAEDAGKKGSLLVKAFAFNTINDAVGTLAGSLSALSAPLVALDTQVKNIGTLGVKNFGEFEDLALQMSTRVPDSAATIAAGAYNAISAGIQGTNQEIISFVETAGKVAVAGVSDTNTAVNALTSVLNAYKLQAADAGSVSDTFFAAIMLGKTSFAEMSAGLANVIPAASAAKISFAEVSGVIAQMTALGVPTAQATTQIRAAIIELQKPGADLAAVMGNVSVEIDGVQQTLNASNIGKVLEKQGLTKTLQQIEGAAAGMGKSLTQVFSSSEAASAALLTTGDNAARMNATLRQVSDEIANNAATGAYEVAAEGIAAQTATIVNTIEAGFTRAFSALGTGANVALQATAKVAPLVSTLGSLGAVIPDGAAKSVANYATSVLNRLVPGLITQTAATTAGTAAQKSFNVAALANPYLLGAALFVGALAGLKLLSDALHETAAEQLEEQQAATAVLQSQRDVTAQRYEAAKAVSVTSQTYKESVVELRKLEAASQDASMTEAQRASAAKQAAEATEILRSRTVDLTGRYPGLVSAGKSFEENLAGIEQASLKSADELIALAGKLGTLDAQLAQSRRIELNLEVAVAGEELENDLTDALDRGFTDSLKNIAQNQGDFGALWSDIRNVMSAGFVDEIDEFFLGTSDARKAGESLVGQFKNDIFNAKTANEIAVAQSELITKIALDGEKLGIDPQEQQKAIASIKKMGDARTKQLEETAKADASLAAQTQATIGKAFLDATALGKGATDSVTALSKAFGVSGEKVREIALGAELGAAADAGELTQEKIAGIADKLGLAGDAVKKAALNEEIKRAAASGTVTADRVKQIADKYSITVDEAKKLVTEQKAQIDAANKATAAVGKLSEAFAEAKKSASDGLEDSIGNLAELYRQRAQAETAEQRKSLDAQIASERAKARAVKTEVDALNRYRRNAEIAAGVTKVEVSKAFETELSKIAKQQIDLRNALELAGIDDTAARRRRELDLRIESEHKALADQRKEIDKNKELTKAQRTKLQAELDALEADQKTDQARRMSDLDRELATAAARERMELAEAAIGVRYARELDLAKAHVAELEAAQGVAGGSEVERLRSIAEARLAVLRAEGEEEIRQIVEKNERVVAARQAVDKALESRDPEAVAAAERELAAVRASVIDSDELVLSARRRQAIAASDVEATVARQVRAAEITAIEDAAERKRELSILEAEKKRDDELAAAQGNAGLQLQAHKNYLAARKEADKQYLRDTNAFADAALDIQKGILAIVDAKTGKEARDARKKEEADHKKRMEEIDAEREKLRSRLEAGIESWEGYQQALDGIEAKRIEEDEKRRQAELEAEDQKYAKMAEKLIAFGDKQADIFNQMAVDGEFSYDRLAAASALTFAGTALQAQSMSDAVFITILEMVTKTINAYVPQIMAAAAGLLGPIFGPAAAGVVIGLVNLKLAEAKAGLGADQGVIGITESYATPRSIRDTIPIWVRPGESVIVPEVTEANRAVLEWSRTHGPDFEPYYREKFQRESAADVQQLGHAVTELAGRVEQLAGAVGRPSKTQIAELPGRTTIRGVDVQEQGRRIAIRRLDRS